ncbi:unnamed protein product [Lampetra fluviatilis]
MMLLLLPRGVMKEVELHSRASDTNEADLELRGGACQHRLVKATHRGRFCVWSRRLLLLLLLAFLARVNSPSGTCRLI